MSESVEEHQVADGCEEAKEGMRARGWFLTINNPESNELAQHEKEKFGVWQKEMGKKGTPHLQGCVFFENAVVFSTIKKLYPRAHIEKVRSQKRAIAYCCKEDTRIEGPWKRGEEPAGQGTRTELQACVDFALETRDVRKIALEYPAEFVKFHKGIKELLKLTDPKNAPLVREDIHIPEYRPFQQEVMDIIKTKPDDRKIHWYWENSGGLGKSRFSRHLVALHGAVSLSGDVKDMSYAYNKEKVVIFDIPRDHGDIKPLFGMAEKLKDGMLFSSKYESEVKIFKSPHVIFFSNEPPPQGVWSVDRLVEHDCNKYTDPNICQNLHVKTDISTAEDENVGRARNEPGAHTFSDDGRTSHAVRLTPPPLAHSGGGGVRRTSAQDYDKKICQKRHVEKCINISHNKHARTQGRDGDGCFG